MPLVAVNPVTLLLHIIGKDKAKLICEYKARVSTTEKPHILVIRHLTYIEQKHFLLKHSEILGSSNFF